MPGAGRTPLRCVHVGLGGWGSYWCRVVLPHLAGIGAAEVVAVVDVAVRHWLHILSEKPIVDTMEASARIWHQVRDAGLKMAVTMSHRFDQDEQSLQSYVHSGEFGRLNYVVHRFTCNNREYGSWGEFRHQIPDPLLVEGTVHHFDILRALTGADARTVYASTWNPPWGEFAGDSTALVTLEMTNGARPTARCG